MSSRIYHDIESTGRISDIRLYYAIRNKILFEKEQYTKIRAIINLMFVLPIIAYYVYISMNHDGKLRLRLLMTAYKDGILSQKSNGLIKW